MGEAVPIFGLCTGEVLSPAGEEALPLRLGAFAEVGLDFVGELLAVFVVLPS